MARGRAWGLVMSDQQWFSRKQYIAARQGRPQPEGPRSPRWFSRLARVVTILVIVSLVLVLFGIGLMYVSYSKVRANINQVVNIELPSGSQATRIYASDYNAESKKGTELGRIYVENRLKADYQDFPPMLVACVLSTEDGNFFTHSGIDFKGNFRAIYNIVRRGGNVRGGASTITQQLARNVFLPYIKNEKTLNRKVQEFILAGALEKKFSKQEILEGYLNHIYFGHQAYGVRSAAKIYFNKTLDQLTLSECAMLAGLPQLPDAYDPYNHPERAETRRRSVLKLLDERGDGYLRRLASHDPDKFKDLKITDAEIKEALETKPKLQKSKEASALKFPYYTTYVRDSVLYPKFGDETVNRQGMVVVTTIVPKYQNWAQEILQKRIDDVRKSKRVSQGAVVLLDAKTGEVLACVGGYGWHTPNGKGKPDELNRAMRSGRQVGSSFKPFTYATAYEQGFPPGVIIRDAPDPEYSKREGKTWPKNSDGSYWGGVSMFYALQHSRNAAAVDLMKNLTGVPPVIELARRMGITADLPEVPALTLGVANIKPIEMAGAFTTFPNMGIHVKPTTVRRIYTQQGNLLESEDTPGAVSARSNPALSQETAYIMVENMKRAVNAGTGGSARVSGVEIAGKTGTCDDYSDAWFVGYSPELVCCVWVGNDDYKIKMNRMFGGNTPALVFHDLMTKVYADQAAKGSNAKYKQRKFSKPAGVKFNGFGGAVKGAGVNATGDEGKAAVPPKKPENAGGEGGGADGGDDGQGDFYEPWDPPSDGTEVHF
jgi:penicillin-binding protein 1A